MSVAEAITRQRVGRFVRFSAVGLVGMVVDLSITFALLSQIHYLAANSIGFAVAVTFNFVGNWTWTFNRPGGNRLRQYVSYVSLHLVTFGIRAVVLTTAIVAVGAPPWLATLVGVGVAALANYLGTETIFEGDGSVWFDIVEAGNHVAHTVYRSPIRRLLLATGLYTPIFRVYAQGLSRLHPGSSRVIQAGDATAEVAIEGATETVSVLHTLEKEGDILDAFAADVGESDRVLDVGANVGVFAAVASDLGADVTAIEPHPPTVERLRTNCPDVDVRPCALGAEYDRVQLAAQHDAAGTQRPTVGAEGPDTHEVRQLPAVALSVAPDVVKIDVEGAEVAVLAGMAAWLERSIPRVIWVETHGTAAAVRECLEGHGYGVTVAREDSETYLRAHARPSEEPQS